MCVCVCVELTREPGVVFVGRHENMIYLILINFHLYGLGPDIF